MQVDLTPGGTLIYRRYPEDDWTIALLTTRELETMLVASLGIQKTAAFVYEREKPESRVRHLLWLTALQRMGFHFYQ